MDPGRATFNVHVLSNEDETDRVLTTFGPYTFLIPNPSKLIRAGVNRT